MNNDEFYVLLYPGVKYGAKLIEMFNELDINYLDYSNLFEQLDPAYALLYDGHPNAFACKVIAKQIHADLLK